MELHFDPTNAQTNLKGVLTNSARSKLETATGCGPAVRHSRSRVHRRRIFASAEPCAASSLQRVCPNSDPVYLQLRNITAIFTMFSAPKTDSRVPDLHDPPISA